MLKLLIGPAIMLASVAAGQTFSFSPQGAEFLRAQVGSVIAGEQAIGAIVCYDGIAATVSGGTIYQRAHDAGYNWILPQGVPSITNRKIQMTKAAKAVAVLKYGSLIGAEIALTSFAKAHPRIGEGLIFAHGIGDDVQPYFAAKVPDASALVGGLINPGTSYPLGPGVCVVGYLMANYSRPPQNAPQPAAAPGNIPTGRVQEYEKAPGVLAMVSW